MAAKAPTRSAAKLRNTEVETYTLPGLDEIFVQDPLTFFEKNEFLGLVARVIERTLARGLDLQDILGALALDDETVGKLRKGELDWSMLPAATTLVGVLSRLFALAPEFMEEAYLIVLSVPRERWYEVTPALRQVDDETGFKILAVFVDQNQTTLRDFLPRWREQLTRLTTTKATEAGPEEG